LETCRLACSVRYRFKIILKSIKNMPLEKNTDKLVIVALDEYLIQAMKIG
jgi:hypothetical protein